MKPLVAIGADHGGFAIKQAIKACLFHHGIPAEDVGVHSTDAADYPDMAVAVAERIVEGRAEWGVLVCTTGIGMSMTANRFTGVRAALCADPDTAAKARNHNDANILVLPGASLSQEQAVEILAAWLAASFSGAERHARRIGKIDHQVARLTDVATLASADPAVYGSIKAYGIQEDAFVNLIASENHVSRAVRQAQGCVMTNKYAEGYPAKRWYNGCDDVDQVEILAIERAKALFGGDHANVQPHCGSAANMAAYFAVLSPGDTILAMRLDQGGHLTHGSPVNFSGRLYHVCGYGVDPTTETLDYEAIESLALQCRPKLIVAGASAYPRTLNFHLFRKIADAVGALLLVDMAHIAGLVAGGAHPSPVPFADLVTTTTHKTLRGPRSGLVLCRAGHAAAIDKNVFPGLQGGPLMHTIAAKAVCLHEAMQPAFKSYAAQIVRNAKALGETLAKRGLRLVGGGTDNHLLLVDLGKGGPTGKAAADALNQAGIIVNKNAIPFDSRSPFLTSGIRLGTPSVTTRGMGVAEMRQIGSWTADALAHVDAPLELSRIRREVDELARAFPAP